jgi:hypothetical protein
MSPASGDVVNSRTLALNIGDQVSIQLMSPASGDLEMTFNEKELLIVSIQLMSPASGDDAMSDVSYQKTFVSIQLMSPASGDRKG